VLGVEEVELVAAVELVMVLLEDPQILMVG
jgi:hypothetical protein